MAENQPIRRIIRQNTTEEEPKVEQPAEQSEPKVESINISAEYHSEIENKAEEASKQLLEYVNEQITRMDNKLLFNGNRDPSKYELDLALSQYEQTLFGLIALYETAKFEEEVAKAKYDEWYAEKYMEVRNTYNTKDVKNASWLSAKEIDATVLTKYKFMAADLKADIISKSRERSTIERLLEGWKSYLWVLNSLCKNAQAEMMANLKGIDLYKGDEQELVGGYGS